MIEQLRKRFIVSAMISIFIVLVFIVGGIYVMNLFQVNRNSDILLQLMINQGDLFNSREGEYRPGDIEHPMDNPAANQNNIPGVSPDQGKPGFSPGMAQGGIGGPVIDAETPYRTRYFVIYYTADGEYSRSNLNNIVSVTEEQAEEYGSVAVDRGKDKGTIATYKYQRFEAPTGETGYYFLDISEDLANVRRNLVSSLVVALVIYIVLLLLIYVISGKIVKPYADNIEMQKRFITDAGHEIKTPLAIISANTDVIEITSGKSEWTENIHSQIKRLNDLVQRLLVLSRMEEDSVQLNKTQFSLSEAVAEVAESFVALAERKSVSFKMDIAPDIIMNGDERGIRELTSVLCDNAVKYCDTDGQVKISLCENGKKKMLAVSNTCESAQEAKVDNWFSRFYREDSSRSRSTGGFGIGLSIAKAVTDAHKAKINAEYQDGKVIMTVEF